MSVYGTGRVSMYAGDFLGSLITLTIRAAEALRYCRDSAHHAIDMTSTYSLQPAIPSAGAGVTSPSLLDSIHEYRNINRLSIALPLSGAA